MAGEVIKVCLRRKNIITLLAKLNRSQNSLARDMDISSGYMAQLLTGTRNPGPKMRVKIMRVFRRHKWDYLFEIVVDRKSSK
jgi:transcriptional regulator with XRE-family HTH domain